MISDVELSRAVNALGTTLRDQRPPRFDIERMQSIVDGSLGGERKLHVRHDGGDRGALVGAGGATLATVDRRDGVWVVRRDVDATGSGWAVPVAGTTDAR
ncbi:MAG: hypothetical protein ACLGI5_14105 [Thermoleophilia bacterium]